MQKKSKQVAKASSAIGMKSATDLLVERVGCRSLSLIHISESKCICCPAKNIHQYVSEEERCGRQTVKARELNYGRIVQEASCCRIPPSCCRSWKVAQDPQEGQKEEGALCVGCGTAVGVLILAYVTLFLSGIAQVIY